MEEDFRLCVVYGDFRIEFFCGVLDLFVFFFVSFIVECFKFIRECFEFVYFDLIEGMIIKLYYLMLK